MRKTKENIKLRQPGKEIPLTDALETEREQRYEEIGGETSSEGVGPSFDSDSEMSQDATSADGPVTGDSLEPPVSEEELPNPEHHGRSKGERKRKKVGRDEGNHLAARSPKKI